MRFSVTLCAVVTALLGIAQANSGFAASCNDWYMTDGTSTMNGECTTDNGHKVHSTLDLNLCIGNSNGYLYANPHGDFFASCSNCDIGPLPVGIPDPLVTTLICQKCTEANGQTRKAQLELDTFIGNVNGQLYCFNL